MRTAKVLAAVSALIALTTANPVNIEKRLPSAKLLERAFGPQESWPKVRAIDVLPAGTLDSRGMPIDETHVFSYGPWEVDKRQSDILKRGLDDHYGERSTVETTLGPSVSAKRSDTDTASDSSSSLTKRDTHFVRTCYNSGSWVSQNALAWGARSPGGTGENFCKVAWNQWAANTALRSFAASKQWYFDEGAGGWKEFEAVGGGRVQVYYEMTQFANWSDTNWCAALFDNLIWGCGGQNPDSAGGQWRQEDGDGCTYIYNGVYATNNCPYSNPPYFTANFVGKIDPYDNTY